MAISKFVPADLSKTAYFTLRRHATERHHAAPSSQSRWTTAERTMTPAEASLKGVDRPPAIKERATMPLTDSSRAKFTFNVLAQGSLNLNGILA